MFRRPTSITRSTSPAASPDRLLRTSIWRRATLTIHGDGYTIDGIDTHSVSFLQSGDVRSITPPSPISSGAAPTVHTLARDRFKAVAAAPRRAEAWSWALARVVTGVAFTDDHAIGGNGGHGGNHLSLSLRTARRYHGGNAAGGAPNPTGLGFTGGTGGQFSVGGAGSLALLAAGRGRLVQLRRLRGSQITDLPAAGGYGGGTLRLRHGARSDPDGGGGGGTTPAAPCSLRPAANEDHRLGLLQQWSYGWRGLRCWYTGQGIGNDLFNYGGTVDPPTVGHAHDQPVHRWLVKRSTFSARAMSSDAGITSSVLTFRSRRGFGADLHQYRSDQCLLIRQRAAAG